MPARASARRTDLLAAYARGALDLIDAALALYAEGVPEGYRVVAVELRLLLCDTTRRHNRITDISLAPRLLPDLRLHPLAPPAPDGALRFDRGAAPLPLPTWLEQPLPAPGGAITLRELIRAVVDQDGGAHVDIRESSPLGPPERLGHGQAATHPAAIIAIGSYVAGELRRQMEAAGLIAPGRSEGHPD